MASSENALSRRGSTCSKNDEDARDRGFVGDKRKTSKTASFSSSFLLFVHSMCFSQSAFAREILTATGEVFQGAVDECYISRIVKIHVQYSKHDSVHNITASVSSARF